MKKSKLSSLKSKVSATPSRRKFLAGLGVAAAAVAAAPAIKSLRTLRAGKAKRGLLAADGKRRLGRPAFLAAMKPLKPLGTLTRPEGTCRLPLEVRPV